MSGPLDPLWRLLREQVDPRHPEEGWRRALGEEALAAANPWLTVSKGRSAAWPCAVPGSAGCERRIVEHAHDDLVAVCGDEPPRCDRLRIERSQLALRRLDLGALMASIAATSGLPEAPVRAEGRHHVLGPLALGVRRFALAVTAESSTLGLLTLAEDLHQRYSVDRVVLLAPVAVPPVAAHLRAFDRVPADLLPLGQVLGEREGRAVADLSTWVVSLREELEGLDPLPILSGRYALVLDPLRERCASQGSWIDFRRYRLPFRLLMGLAARPDALVTRDELFDAVWPGGDPSESESWEVNLRALKSKLARRLGGAGALLASVDGDTLTGGYRLLLAPDRVLWWSRLPE